MTFREYMHIERFGNDEVQGIELGTCYIFPKIDGTNGSVWWDEYGLHAGSRKRILSLDDDNAGFYKYIMGVQNQVCDFFMVKDLNKILRLYGEWLVPHSLKTYRDDAWRRFYIFDVYDDEQEKYLPYDVYKPLLDEFNLDYIPAMSVIKNASYDNLLKELEDNRFLIQEGTGCGEGIVIKNYNYKNRFGRTVWAKIVTNHFKEKHARAMGPITKELGLMVEQKICDEYITDYLVNKTYAKIANECEGWNSRYIPRLLSTVYHDFVTEDLWNAVKNLKNPTINFKTLNILVINKIKEVRPELF